MGDTIYNLLITTCSSGIDLVANDIGFWPLARQMYITCASTVVGWDIFFRNLVNFLVS